MEEVDRGGSVGEEEYLEGWPVVGKALKDLAMRAIICLKWVDEKLLEVTVWVMEQLLIECGEAQGEIAQSTMQGIWRFITQIIPDALQAMSCHAGSTVVELEVPPYDCYEIISLKNTWGELWKPNATF